MENIAKILSILRVSKNLTQCQMAKKLYISQSQLQKMESGDKDFPLSKFINYATILGIKPTSLLECLMMGTAKPDEAVRKAIHEINNPNEQSENKMSEEEMQKLIANYIDEKIFPLQKEYLKILNMHGIQRMKNKTK